MIVIVGDRAILHHHGLIFVVGCIIFHPQYNFSG